MGTGVRIIWSEDFAHYDFGPLHPMSPIRLRLTARLAEAFGLFDDGRALLGGAGIASDDLLELVHEPGFIAAVKAAAEGHEDPDRGLGTEDDPIFPAIHDSSARIVQASVDAAEQVWSGAAEHGVNVCGGMHHAMPDHASGFCVYNDIAAAIQRLLDLGAERIVYVDVDAHHGDGVQHIFYDDPRVVTVSIHESGTQLFPGTGFAGETGGPGALGTAVNVALPSGIGDPGWLRALHAIVPPVVRAVRPDILVTQHGCDSHHDDPLTHLNVTVDAQREAARLLHDLAHDVCDGKWLAVGGGGYEIIGVVPRVWTHLMAIALHEEIPVDARIPESWLTEVERVWGHRAPELMGDLDGEPVSWISWARGYDPDDPVDRAILATRKATFEHFGLDPLFD